ncbi:MAG: metallophosphoesterase family protein [Armatimonadetes bacterium]|nr:metallophosphoesterase family protein [Armatimonadota bacterium]
MLASTVLFLALAPHVSPTTPHRILLTWSGDPATSASVTWRTEAPTEGAEGEIAPADADPAFVQDATKTIANSQPLTIGETTVHYHTVTFKDLTPETLYAYRVGTQEEWSEWVQFRTASATPKPFTFIYFGDAQNDLKSLWSRTVRQAYRHDARADFMIHAGDLVNSPNADGEWRDWFYAGGWVHSMLPSIAVPGNHEYRCGKLSDFWIPQFEFPRNGLPQLPDTNYYIDFQGARIIALDSNRLIEEQAAWLDGVLKDNPNKWTFVTFHHPIFSTAQGRDNPGLRAAWQPILEKYNVALVLQGHDHTYGRRNVTTGLSAVNEATGTAYVVSVSGPKMYTVGDEAKRTMQKTGERKQLYQIIRVNGDTVQYRAYLVTGELYDAFDLRKNPDGTNTFVSVTISQTADGTSSAVAW